MESTGNDDVTRVLRWAGTTRGVAEPVILIHEAGWLHDREFMRECAVPAADDPDRVVKIDWPAVDAFLGRHRQVSTPAVQALRRARALAPVRRRS